MQDEITKVFEQWNGPFSPEKDVADADDSGEFETDPILVRLNAIIDSDIKELCGRYQLKDSDKNSDIIGLNGGKEQKGDDVYLRSSSFPSEDYPILDNISTDLLIKELNVSRSTLDSSVCYTIKRVPKFPP